MMSHPKLPWKICSLKCHVVTKHEHVAQGCSHSQLPSILGRTSARVRTRHGVLQRRQCAPEGCRSQIRLEEMMGWIHTVVLFSTAVCLWLPNEALLIQIRVNDYLIIPILQRALAPSVLCSVNLQHGNPESVAQCEPLILGVGSSREPGQAFNRSMSYMLLWGSAITWIIYLDTTNDGFLFSLFFFIYSLLERLHSHQQQISDSKHRTPSLSLCGD